MQARFTISTSIQQALRVLLGDGRLFRAFFYTGVDAGADVTGFLLWMRRNGFRVVQKELKTFYDGTRKQTSMLRLPLTCSLWLAVTILGNWSRRRDFAMR